MYVAIEALGGVSGGGMVYCVFFIILVLFGNCKLVTVTLTYSICVWL